MNNVIETTDLVKAYNGRQVVDRVNLAVPEGSVYGFIGPNGAGKSTTMKMLLGLVHPTGGKVEILGKTMNPDNRLTLLKQTGSLIESPACYGHLTGQENLEILAQLKDVPKTDIDRVLEIVELTQCRHRKLKTYSLGMRQRLGIAQALLGNPKVLILDEPTNGLDPAGIQQMRALIRDMPRRCGASVLISSHLLSEMEQMADQVGILNQGKLLFQGPLSRLRAHSQGDITLRLLRPELAGPVLKPLGVQAAPQVTIPAMEEERLAALVAQLAPAGVVELTRRTKTLEEIFLSLTEGDPMKTIAAELKKSHRRYDGLVAVGIAVFVLLWCSVGKDTAETRATGYSALLYAVPVIHSVVMPLGMAVLASRCWDLESKAQNCRILFTIQSRGALFLGKSAVALLHLLALTLVEGVGFLLMGKLHGYTEPLDMGQFWWLMVCTLAVNAMLFFQALLLSIRFDSQVPTLAAGMLASLSGIFAGFMPPVVSYFLPWSYYIPLTAMTMDWTRQTRVVRYIPREFPLGLLAVCLVLGALSAWAAWQALKRKEV